MPLRTVEEEQLELDDAAYGEELMTWLVVYAVNEPDFATEVNLRIAFDLLEDHFRGSARLIADTMDNVCLLVDPTSEEAVTMASSLATDLAYGVSLDPDRLEKELAAHIDEIWDNTDLAGRIDWLLQADELSLEHVVDDRCPSELVRIIAHDYHLI
jgi:hypothetical protein